MKKQLLLIITIITSLVTQAQKYKYLGGFNADGVPNYLVKDDQVSSQLISNIKASLPDNHPVPKYNSQYIAPGIGTDIELTQMTDVWVTFVYERTGHKNVLGFYTYDLNAPLVAAPTPEEITIIFPNVSFKGSGGGLHAGNKVHLGTFPANTGIGWVLVPNAWNGSGVGHANWTIFSNPNFNPESDPNLRHHSVLLNDSYEELVVLGFEETRRDNSGCDNDFNDIIFYITARPYISINTANLNEISQSGGSVGSGNDGGLESHGNLSSKIAKRYYDRQFTEHKGNQKDKQLAYDKIENQNRDELSLMNFIPAQDFEGNMAMISTPQDLLQLSNAKDVLSADYYAGNVRKAAVLMTRTEGFVYDHTKMVCDRLKGGRINNIAEASMYGFDFILAELQQANGAIEYALSFSMDYSQADHYELMSKWNLADYPAGNFFNIQIWAENKAVAKSMFQLVVDNFLAKRQVLQTQEGVVLPHVFVQQGQYKNGMLTLQVQNLFETPQVTCKGSAAMTELDERQDVEWAVDLNGNLLDEISIPTDNLFDVGFGIYANGELLDMVYFADGSWGVDYAQGGATITNYNVTEEDRFAKIDERMVERSIQCEGQIKDYVSVYRNLNPAMLSEDLAGFNALELEGQYDGVLQITIVKEDISNWADQYSIYVNLKESNGKVVVPFQNFTSQALKGVPDFSDATAIVFSIVGDGQNEQDFSLKLKNLKFTKADFEDNTDQMSAYPNPVNDQVWINADWTRDEMVYMSVTTLAGQTVQKTQLNMYQGVNVASIDISTLQTGTYLLIIQGAQSVQAAKVVKE